MIFGFSHFEYDLMKCKIKTVYMQSFSKEEIGEY